MRPELVEDKLVRIAELAAEIEDNLHLAALVQWIIDERPAMQPAYDLDGLGHAHFIGWLVGHAGGEPVMANSFVEAVRLAMDGGRHGAH